MRSDLISRLKAAAPEIVADYPEILSAYLFGSAAQGLDREGSDADVAVRIAEDVSTDRRLQLILDLTGRLEDALDRPADVVIINTASLALIHQVIKTGILLYAADAQDETAFMLQKQKEYFDFKYYLDKDRKALRAYFGC